MSSDQIQTSTDNDQDFQNKPVTGTQVGSKRHLDVIMGGAIPTNYDDIVLTYTGCNLTGVVYKLAGATLKTLTLTYVGCNLTRVEVA